MIACARRELATAGSVRIYYGEEELGTASSVVVICVKTTSTATSEVDLQRLVIDARAAWEEPAQDETTDVEDVTPPAGNRSGETYRGKIALAYRTTRARGGVHSYGWG